MTKTPPKKFALFAALHEESRAGWVWVSPGDSPEATFIRIRRHAAKGAVVCERRTADANFRRYYNERPYTNKLPDSGPFLVISDSYRTGLGVSKAREAELELSEAGFWSRHLTAYNHHPDAAIRLGVRLGVLSVALGLFGALPFIAAGVKYLWAAVWCGVSGS
ncbi:MAG: hypothetical protein ACRD1X_08145 [Vicinamibacteria bacterium]